jgi:DNA-binding XRE family transcriptional regulator
MSTPEMQLAIAVRDAHPPGMQTRVDAVEIGRRLKATRDALGLTGTEFARRARIAQNAYSQYETGRRLLTVTVAMRLCTVYGLSMDWLFRGDPSSLPYALAGKIMAPGSATGGPQNGATP